jgi:hypothetical protein
MENGRLKKWIGTIQYDDPDYRSCQVLRVEMVAADVLSAGAHPTAMCTPAHKYTQSFGPVGPK